MEVWAGCAQHSFVDLTKDWVCVLIAIAGKDFIKVASDTRVSTGYSILMRKHSKTTQLTKDVVITSGGMVADIEALHKNLLTRIKIYKMQNKREPNLNNLAKLLSNMLYGRRFMPYYAFNLLCGLDPTTGEGVVMGYDAVGSFDRINYGGQGSGQSLAMTVLDSQFHGHNFLVKQLPESQETVENVAKDIIHGVAERDIYTGDNVEIVTVDKDGVRRYMEPIRRD